MNQDVLNVSAREDFLHNVAYAYFRWKWLATTTFAVLFAMIFFAGYLIAPMWTAELYLLPEPAFPPPTSDLPDPTRLKTQQKSSVYGQHVIMVLTGKEMACTVVKKFGIDESLRKKSEEPDNLRDKISAGASDTLKAFVSAIQGLFGAVGKKMPDDWVDRAAAGFRKGLFSTVTAEMVEETDVIKVSIAGESPEQANVIAAFMVDTLRQKLGDITVDGAKATVAALRVQLRNVTKQVEDAERAWYVFVEANKGVDPSEIASLRTADLSKLNSERSRLRVEKMELERQRDEGMAGDGTQKVMRVSDRILADNVVQQLRTALHAQRAALALRLEEVTDKHPDVVSARAQIRQTEDELKAEFDGILRDVGAELRTKDAEVAAAEAELSQISAKQFESSRLKMDVEVYRALRRELQNHVESVAVTAESGFPSLTVKVLDRALVSPAASQDSKKWIIVAIVAIVFATGAAVVLPPFIEYWRDPIRGPNDLAARGLVPLGVISKLPRRQLPRLDREERTAG